MGCILGLQPYVPCYRFALQSSLTVFYVHIRTPLQMVRQYECTSRLQWTHARTVLAHTLRTRSIPAVREAFYHTRVLPRDTSCKHVAAPLVSAVRRLRWAIQRDRLAHFVKDRSNMAKNGGLVKWLESNGRSVMSRENERVRLAVCPGIKGIVKYYEGLAR